MFFGASIAYDIDGVSVAQIGSANPPGVGSSVTKEFSCVGTGLAVLNNGQTLTLMYGIAASVVLGGNYGNGGSMQSERCNVRIAAVKR